MKTALQILRESRELLSDSNQWTKGAFARNAIGGVTDTLATSATCWCSLGAVAKVAGKTDDEADAGFDDFGDDGENNPEYEALEALERALDPDGTVSIASYNDAETTTHADVLALFDAGIAKLAAKEAA